MPGKVLIADDSLKVQKEFTQLLQQAGIEVATVSNGEHAVRKLSTIKPDIVLADVFMPVRNGYEVCEHIRNSQEFGNIRVFLLVSKMDPFDEKQAQRVRADGKVEKPMGDPALAQQALATIKQVLDMIHAAKPAPRAAAIDEFAAAVPAEGEVEPEQFSTRPAPVTFDTSAPIGLADVVEEAPPLPAVSEAPADEAVDLSGATMLTTSDELKKRIAETKQPREEAPAAAVVEATPVEEEVPAAEVVATEPVAAAAAPQKPELAPAWEMTGPPPGVKEQKGPVWDSQWSGSEEAAPAEALPGAGVTEAPTPPSEAPPATPYAPEEFAAAMSAALSTQPAQPAGPQPPAPRVDPAVVDEIVRRVMKRISPMVLQALATEFVRPLAENLLRDYYDEQKEERQL